MWYQRVINVLRTVPMCYQRDTNGTNGTNGTNAIAEISRPKNYAYFSAI